jgi:hypothetical protein
MPGVSRSVSSRAVESVAIAPNTWIRKVGRTRRFAGCALVWSVGFTAMFLLPNRPLHHPLGAELGAGAFFVGMAALGLLLAHRLRQAASGWARTASSCEIRCGPG